MDRQQFGAILPIIVADLIDKITYKYKLSEDAAIWGLYGSALYIALENEETKVWQYSSEKLLELYMEEKQTGHLEMPDY